MKIYLASSWKNATNVKQIAGELRELGHEVDAFCDTSTGRFVFSFSQLPAVDQHNAMTILAEEPVKQAFAEDKKWIDWADCVLLILPAGKSSHLEAGYAKGAGKLLIIYQEQFPLGEFDVMYGFADLVTDKFKAVVDQLKLLSVEEQNDDEKDAIKWLDLLNAANVNYGLNHEGISYHTAADLEKAREIAKQHGMEHMLEDDPQEPPKGHHVKINGKRITEVEAITAYDEGKTIVVYKTENFQSGMAYAGECFGQKYARAGQTKRKMVQFGSHDDAVYTLREDLAGA